MTQEQTKNSQKWPGKLSFKKSTWEIQTNAEGHRYFRPDKTQVWKQESIFTSTENGTDICPPLYGKIK